MPSPRDLETSEQSVALARAALERERSPFRTLPRRLVLVDVRRQRLALIEDGRVLVEYPVSTASAGVGGAQDSFRTPPGWHRVHARIGAGEPEGAVFESRARTGRVWRGEAGDQDLILTRVITLEGLEASINRGPGCDSLERTIYIHGTNHPELIGTRASHGCVRMHNDAVADLFDRLEEGDPVVIVDEPSPELA